MSVASDPSADASQRVVNVEQAEAWNGDDGRHWVAHRDRYDAMLPRFTRRLMQAADVSPGERVLDIGCGAGETTCAAARAARGGTALGADISRPLLGEARRRAEREGLDNVRFEEADAQVHPFGAGRFDVAISRFGVMFFADPAAAFANIARALAPGGRLAFLAWQQAAHNEWVVTLGAALAAHVELPQMGGDGPGPFSLADPEGIRQLLGQTGLTQVTVDAVTEPIRLGSDVEDVIDFAQDLGLVRDLLADVDTATKSRALDGMRDALAPHHTEDGILLGAAAWLVTARHQ
ncbi:MAG: methyltransferase domain-containing protein [Streptosporangiales bacterium]|nr:methyltransferase domain-containing protein [Streptosporangiales bacterium]